MLLSEGTSLHSKLYNHEGSQIPKELDKDKSIGWGDAEILVLMNLEIISQSFSS